MNNDFLLDEIKQLTTNNEQAKFKYFYSRYSKNILIAYLLLIFLGVFGIHKFYLNKASAWLYLIFAWTLIPLLFVIIDLFLLSWQVKKYNQRLAINLVDLIKEHKDINTNLMNIELRLKLNQTNTIHYVFITIFIVGIMIPAVTYAGLLLNHYQVELKLKEMNPDGSSFNSILSF
ncbi:MAG: TM2 domain-containing protein [Burkholderiales bacterium]|nr:TM2 domain-containing protein [Burkholderiales bacterium]